MWHHVAPIGKSHHSVFKWTLQCFTLGDKKLTSTVMIKRIMTKYEICLVLLIGKKHYVIK